MIWTALLPIKPDGERKTRLAGRMASAERGQLGQMLLDRLVGELRAVARIDAIVQLSVDRPARADIGWIADRGGGLNAEIEAARAMIGAAPLLVIHPDLPLVGVSDIEAMLDGAEEAGCAIAMDRHVQGTNALALADGRTFRFRFGPGSLALHRAEAGPRHRLIERTGLALDCDTPDDLDRAIAGGFLLPVPQ